MHTQLILRCGALAVLALSSACSQSSSTSGQTTWYVDASGTPSGSGTQSDPYTSIQDAISRPTTLNGHTVLVAPGTYHEQIDYLGKSIRVIGESGAASTVIVAPFANDSAPGVVHNASVVTFDHAETADTMLSGFTITGGFGTGNNYGTEGGGIYCVNASPTLVDLIVEGNAASYGGGMLVGGYAHVVGCTVQNNSGGGALGGPVATFEACTFRVNTDGAGFSGSSTLRNCLIEQNHGSAGGGVTGADPQHFGPTLISCTIRNNTSDYYGGGVFGTATLTDCAITGNAAKGQGGGVYGATANGCEIAHNTLLLWNGAEPISHGGGAADSDLVECDVHDNAAISGEPDLPSFGGGVAGGTATRCRIWNNTADKGAACANVFVESCTVYGNTASVDGGAFAKYPGPSVHIHNTILWNDSPDELPAGAMTLVTYSDVAGGHAGTGNIALDPLFVSPLTGDFHLKPGSPCIDTGDPADHDPDGSRIDIGAYPFDASLCGPLGRYRAAKTNSQGCTPEISWSGTPSLSGPDDFLVTASHELNQSSGFLIWSTTRASTFVPGGILYVAAFKRTPAQDSEGSALPAIDCSGRYRFHFSHAFMAEHELTVGTTVYAQYVARDPFHIDRTGTSLSNALEFTICP
jgi:hypothetical protein